VPVELRLSKRFLKSLENLSDKDYVHTDEALRQLQQLWGTPHTHAELSIRRLHAGYFECRAGLDIRIVFRAGTDGLDLILAGTHADVRRLLRNE
jgi:mRNA-degrading endonuclease YafQ of YafQ-DinJ toxin-antitoxin module